VATAAGGLRRIAGVTAAEIDADPKGRLYYHGDALITIDAAFREPVLAKRFDAILAVLFDYHDLGYDMGLGDGAIVTGSGVQGLRQNRLLPKD
jgi:hypothetical protein